ncbi:hypothetical protein BHM03_00049847 [Ensete ventricosum]|nr:hypothetical protein BHM03_00049847 [Ensete ventricosum]
MQVWLAMAKSPARAAGHDLATCKGATGCDQGPLPAQGVAGCDLPARGCCQQGQRCRPHGRLPTDKGSRRLRRGGDGDATRVREEG